MAINTVDLIGDEALTASIIDRSITEIADSEVSSVGQYAFYNCTQLTSADFPKATSVGNYAFQGCSALSSVNFPALTTIGSNCFKATGLTDDAEFPGIIRVETSSFSDCNSLEVCKMLPNATYLMGQAFKMCNNLRIVDLPKVGTISTSVFDSCKKLETLILRKTDSICVNQTAYNFYGTLIASKKGYIYVPSALIDTYKAATNWSALASQFRALESYTVDGTTTGELDPTKI